MGNVWLARAAAAAAVAGVVPQQIREGATLKKV